METLHDTARESELARLIERAAAGEEIMITTGGKPIARLVPLAGPDRIGRIGVLSGRSDIWIGENFDDPLPEDLLAGFEGTVL